MGTSSRFDSTSIIAAEHVFKFQVFPADFYLLSHYFLCNVNVSYVTRKLSSHNPAKFLRGPEKSLFSPSCSQLLVQTPVLLTDWQWACYCKVYKALKTKVQEKSQLKQKWIKVSVNITCHVTRCLIVFRSPPFSHSLQHCTFNLKWKI